MALFNRDYLIPWLKNFIFLFTLLLTFLYTSFKDWGFPCRPTSISECDSLWLLQEILWFLCLCFFIVAAVAVIATFVLLVWFFGLDWGWSFYSSCFCFILLLNFLLALLCYPGPCVSMCVCVCVYVCECVYESI